MKALPAKSQFVEVEGLTAFGPRFLDENLKLRARTLVVDDFFPTLVAVCKLTQLIKHSPTLGFAEFWQFLNDFRCAHGSKYILSEGARQRSLANARLCRQAFACNRLHLLTESIQLA
jgi:hypothetical protein